MIRRWHGTPISFMVMTKPVAWKTSNMSIDRKKLLLRHSNALAALSHPDLPDPIRALWKKALDLSEALLGLQDAMKRKKARQPQSRRREG